MIFRNLYKIGLCQNGRLYMKTQKRLLSGHGTMSGLSEGTKYVRKDHTICEPSPKDEKNIDIELLLSPTPNGHKVSILLEELEVPYRVHCIDLGGEQFSTEFLKHSPNGKIPAIISAISLTL